MSLLRLVFAIVVWGISLCAGQAHEVGLSTAEATLRADGLTVTIALAPDDARKLLPPETGHGEANWTKEEFATMRPGFEAAAGSWWEVTNGTEVAESRLTAVELVPGDNVSVTLDYGRSGEGVLRVRARLLERLPADHRHVVMVTDERGVLLSRRILTASDPVLTTDAAPVSGRPTFWAFLKLGVEHIWTGYDHLLFLLALLVACRSVRSVLIVISCFTVAHSITLAFATLEWVRLSPRITESLIAASIVFVGVENLWRRGEEPRGRWLLTLIFGLVHGFGFANVLRDLGVGRGAGGVAMPLFSFNLGVEIGQVAIAAAVLPAYWRLARNEKTARRILRGTSIVTVALGMFWLVERTLRS